MEHLFGTWVICTAIAFCLATTWSSAAAPAAFARRLGLAVANPGGSNEVRAQYGGFFSAVAVACLASMTGALPRAAIYVLLMVTFGGLVAGRIVSLAIDHGLAGYPRTIKALYVVDAIGFGLATAAFLADHSS